MLRWLVIILAAPVALWSAYWGAAALAMKQGAETFLQDQTYGELSSRFADTRLRGFPSEFRLSVSDIELRNAALFSWATPMVRMSAPSYSPQTVSLAVSGPQTIQSRLGDLEIDAQRFDIGLFFRPELALPLGNALLQLETAQITHDAGWHLTADRLLANLQDIAADGADPDSPAKTQGDYRLDLDARGLDLSTILPDLPPAYHEITSFKAGTTLRFSRPWDRAVFDEGPPELRRLVIRQAKALFGDTTIALSGQLEASQKGVVSGRIVADIRGWRELLDMLRQTGYMDPDMAGLIQDTVGEQIDPTEPLEIPLQIDDGMVSFGIFSLGLLPPLP